MTRFRPILLLILFLLLAAVIALWIGFAASTDPGVKTAQTASIPSSPAQALRSSMPQYLDLDTGKGLEVYVWMNGENQYLCGLLPGTNRNKTSDEILELSAHPASIDEMKLILSTYDIPDDSVFIILCTSAASSYYYEIDEEMIKTVSGLFDDRYHTGTMG